MDIPVCVGSVHALLVQWKALALCVFLAGGPWLGDLLDLSVNVDILYTLRAEFAVTKVCTNILDSPECVWVVFSFCYRGQ